MNPQMHTNATGMTQHERARCLRSIALFVDVALLMFGLFSVYVSLSVLVRKLQTDQIIDIVDKLGVLVIDPKKAESRDIYRYEQRSRQVAYGLDWLGCTCICARDLNLLLIWMIVNF